MRAVVMRSEISTLRLVLPQTTDVEDRSEAMNLRMMMWDAGGYNA